ncbi:MAG: D-glycerate dehydrogenase [Solirubrobacteraceae bacterium]|nr:D-glycerate dehydrogenase [Solirubrobacteraceae bacterium]
MTDPSPATEIALPQRAALARARVAITGELPGSPERLLRDAGHDVVVRSAASPATPEELRALAEDADALLCTLADRVDQSLLDAAPRLRAIANYAVGYDNIELAAAAARGVAVGNTPDVLTDATADLAMALLLAAARRLPEAEADVREGRWDDWNPRGLLGLELRGARLAIVGAGRIGQAVGERAAAFGMELELVGRDDDLHAALGRADVVSLHAPLTPATRHLIDASAIAAMKPGAILVNTARGPLVDQVALADALHRGRLRAAALDVTDPEPLPVDDPLLAAPNLIVLPHIGSATERARAAMGERAARNLIAALAGDPMPWPVRLPSP